MQRSVDTFAIFYFLCLCEDNLYYHAFHHPGATGVVPRRLHSTQEGISSFDSRLHHNSCRLASILTFSYLGFDLVGNEHLFKPLIYYAEQLLSFPARCRAAGVDIPLILHAGETLGDGTEADMNLYDAILLGTKRIGHGCANNCYCVYHYSLLSRLLLPVFP